jgi:gas vesicle protein
MTHAMTHAHKDDVAALFGFAAMAALLGATAALLLAPRSGKDTRDDLMRKVREAQERSRQRLAQNTAQKTTQDIPVIKDTVTDSPDVVADARSQVEDVAGELQVRARSRRPAD